MSIEIKIQAKTEEILLSEASFYGVPGAALVRAIIDKVAGAGLTRGLLQGVDVKSYVERSPGRPKKSKAEEVGQ